MSLGRRPPVGPIAPTAGGRVVDVETERAADRSGAATRAERTRNWLAASARARQP